MATTQKTKLTNTFRFKSFNDRINEIDLRHLALYHIGHQNEEPEAQNETFFHQSLNKWMMLNLTEEYNYFSKRCLKIVTLPQLLHQKDIVIDLLLERLATATNLSQQPLLELLYVLARDLREDFYPYFQRVLDRLICLLNTQDAEQLEWTLICLAHLFKALKPFLKRNIGVVFNAILPLLDEEQYEEHVTNFAVECFAFIARDVRDFPRFLDFILHTVLREQVKSVHGCGRLLFELLRSVNGKFHSVAGELLQNIFESFTTGAEKHSRTQRALLVEIMAHAIDLLLRFLQPDQMPVFWQQLCNAAQKAAAPAVAHLLHFMLPVVQHKDGRFVCELSLLVPTLLQLYERTEHGVLVQLVSRLLQARQAQLSQLDCNRLLQRSLAVPERDIYEQFITSLLDYQQFELLVLPNAVAYYETHLDLAALELLARIVLHKQPLHVNAIPLSSWQPVPLNIKRAATSKAIEEQLQALQLQQEQHLLLLILAPHLRGFDKQILDSKLPVAMQQLLASTSLDNKQLKLLLLLLQTHTLLQFKLAPSLAQSLVEQLLPHTAQPYALGCLQLLYAQLPLKQLPVQAATDALAPLLSVPSGETRLIAAHCLKSLHARSGIYPYGCFYEAACIEPNIHNYRELLLQLQKLETAGELYKKHEAEAAYKIHTVSFLLGLLYYNFKYVWEPVQKLLEAYAKVMPLEDFWQLYKAKLDETAACIDYKAIDHDATPLAPAEEYKSKALCALLPCAEAVQLTQQQAHTYRQLLWQKLPHFGALVEVKNADIVRSFLAFITREYRTQLEKHEYTWNLLKPTQAELADVAEVEAEHELEDDVDDGQPVAAQKRGAQQLKRKKLAKQHTYAKFILQTLQSKLACFVEQPNPKALHRQMDLRAFYLELLAGPNPQLQKLALDCLVAYKEQALNSYKEQLYALIDENKFKSTLVSFELAAVQAQHRDDFMKYMLRVLYGKMLTKGTQRQLSAQQRKTLILRFLGQLDEEEILWFLRMAFGRYERYTTQPVSELDGYVLADFQPESVCAAKQLQRIVNLLELIRKEFAGRMHTKFQQYVLKLLLFVGSVCQQVAQVEQSQLSNAKLLTVYRNVKTAALQTLVNYFGQMEQHEWQPAELQAICTIYVWPALARLPQDSIHTPTPLLKLLLLWGEQTRYITYLGRSQAGDTANIFSYLMQLWHNDKAKPPVRRALLALVEQLLVAVDAQQEHAGDALAVIEPFIPDILQRLQRSFSTRNPKQPLDKRELHILTLLTAHDLAEPNCKSLLELLLPIFQLRTQGNASEEVVCQIVTTMSNLIGRLTEPECYLRHLAPFFEQVHVLPARKQLCTLIADIAKIKHRQVKTQNTGEQQALEQTLRETARIVLLLNAWDKRWVEQPDYDKRLQALRELEAKLQENAVDMELGVLVIHNCFYFLRHDKDLGLRVNISEHLKLLLPHLTRKYSEDKAALEYLVGEVFIKLVQRTIRSDNENVRNEGISLLGEMARQCPQAHEVLSDLAPLCERHDVEVDFFENMTHLQTQRHGRALQRFCTLAANWRQAPTPRTLTQFLLPLASRYLLNERHVGKHTLVDVAIETVGITCQLLPWQHYHAVLRYYLQKLRHSHEHQRQCVRIVVRILDAFHFDLTQAQTDAQALATLRNVLTEQMPGDQVKVADAAEEAANAVEATHENGAEATPAPAAAAADVVDDEQDDEDALTAALQTADAEASLASAEGQPSASQAALALNSTLSLTPSAARRVLGTITSVLIPTLNRAITEKSSYDTKHKLNRKRLGAEREDEETQRVPIALALVKLMQKLPKTLLENGLPGVFMKVCTFLRSPLKSVRMLTRDILKKIMVTLGGSYFALLMEHLQSLLTRGFQVHVLSVTVHGVLDALRNELEPAHIESCLKNLLEVALNDIFGDVTAEKEVGKIIAHAPEAKPSAKSFLTLHIAARNVRENCLLDLLLPFREHLARTQSRKVTLKIQDCFAKIVSGLAENQQLPLESLLIFIYGTMSESIADLLPGTAKRVLSEQEKAKMRRARPDCYLIQPEPARRSSANIHKAVKTSAQANAHILVELGMELLHIVLKRKKLLEIAYQPFVQPLLPLLCDALKSTHLRVTTFGLKCFTSIWQESYVLPALGACLPNVAEQIFKLLKNFSTFGAAKQEDNSQLVRACLKAVIALLLKCEDYQLNEQQIEQLVLHIEEQLHEGDNQPMCYALLKALITRKVDTKSIHVLMKQVSELSIISQSDFVREETRGILLTYLMEYALFKRVEQYVKSMTVQLSYALPAGRLSAVEFIKLIVKRFPHNALTRQAEFLYISLATRLVNDEDTDCRRVVAEAIEMLLSRLNKVERTPILDMTLLFFAAEQKPGVREMGALLISRFVNVEKSSFAMRLKLVLPTVLAALTRNNPNEPGRFVRAPTTQNGEVDVADLAPRSKRAKYMQQDVDPDAELLNMAAINAERVARKQRENDHELIQVQFCLLKMFEFCGSELTTQADLVNYVDELAYESQRLLAHEHNWVRCNAAKLITQIIAQYDFAYVGRRLSQNAEAEALDEQEKPLDFIYLNPAHDIKSLVLDMCAQVIPGDTAQEMVDELVKIFLYLANMLRDVPFSTVKRANEDDAAAPKINLSWLVRNIRFLINKEMAKAPHAVAIRTALFTLIEGLITLLSVESLEKLSSQLLYALVREMDEEDQNIDAELRRLAIRVGNRLRKRIGATLYDTLRNEVLTKQLQRRAERRKMVAQQKVHDPALAAKRKASVQERKKVAKRLKTAVMRGKAADTKQKLKKRKRKADADVF